MTDTTVADAVDSIPVGQYHRRLLVVTGALMGFAAVEILIISFVLPTLVGQWNLSGIQAGALGSAGLVGLTVGNPVGGWAADRWGRVGALRVSVIGYSAFAALTALSVGFLSATAARFLAGLFVGASITVDVSYLTEHLPSTHRGRYLVYLEIFWPLGTVLGTALAWVVLLGVAVDGSVLGIDAWRLLFFATAFPALLAPVLRRALAETPYFLAAAGRVQDANERLGEIAERNGTSASDLPPVERGGGGSAGDTEGGFGQLFSPSLRGRTLLVSALWFGLNFGFYGVFIWLPSTLEAVQLGGDVYTQLFLVALVQLPGIVSASALIDRWGRRPTIGGYLALSGLFLGLFSDSLGSTSFVAGLVPVPPLGSLFLASFFIMGAWGSMFAYTTEAFPTSVRARGFGFAQGVGKVASIIGPILVGALLPLGYRIALLPFGVVVLLSGLLMLAFGTETSGEPLST